MRVLSLEAGIDFGARGNLQEFDPVGFSLASDAVSTWSEASTAALTFRLPPLRFDLRFTIEVFPYLGDGRLTQQDCWVFINGLFAFYQAVRDPLEMIFTVERDLFNPRANRLAFALPHATAPKDLGLGNDLRLLGLAFVKIRVGDARAAVSGAASDIRNAAVGSVGDVRRSGPGGGGGVRGGGPESGANMGGAGLAGGSNVRRGGSASDGDLGDAGLAGRGDVRSSGPRGGGSGRGSGPGRHPVGR